MVNVNAVDLARFVSYENQEIDQDNIDFKKLFKPSKEAIKYLAAMNEVLTDVAEFDERKFVVRETLISRVWCDYVSDCIGYGKQRLLETIQKIGPKGTHIPPRNIILLMEEPDKDCPAALAFALVKREKTCRQLGTKAKIRVLRGYQPELDEVIKFYCALIADAEASQPYYARDLTITVYDQPDFADALKDAANTETLEDEDTLAMIQKWRDSVRIVAEDEPE